MSLFLLRFSVPQLESWGYSDLTLSEFFPHIRQFFQILAPAFRLVNTISEKFPALAINILLINTSICG
jgi:hypothetical protein